jgi:hypothetical protein
MGAQDSDTTMYSSGLTPGSRRGVCDASDAVRCGLFLTLPQKLEAAFWRDSTTVM